MVKVSTSKTTVVYVNRIDNQYLSVMVTRMYCFVDHGTKMEIANVSRAEKCIDGGSCSMIIVIVRMSRGILLSIMRRLMIMM